MLNGDYHSSVGDHTTALRSYARAANLNKKYAPAYNGLGYSHFRLGNYKEAEEAFRTYISLLPDRPNPYDSYAELLLRTGRYDESIAQYSKALEKDSSFAFSLKGIGDNYLFKGDHARARDHYQQQFDTTQSADVKFDALNLITTSYVYEGKTVEALKANEQARRFAEKEKLVPNAIGTYSTAAFILAESGDTAGALKQIEQASKLREDSSLPASLKESFRLSEMITRTRVLTMSRQLDEAKSEAEKARPLVEATSNAFQKMYFNEALGHLELAQERYDKAIEYFSKANPENSYPLYYMAVAYEKRGDKAKASGLFAKTATLNRNHLAYAFIRPRVIAKMGNPAKTPK